MEEVKSIFGKLKVVSDNGRNIKLLFSKVEDGSLWNYESLEKFFFDLEVYGVSEQFLKTLLYEIKISKNIDYKISLDRTDDDLKIKEEKELERLEELKKKKEEAFIEWEPILLPKNLLSLEETIKTKIPLTKILYNPILKTKISSDVISREKFNVGLVNKNEIVAVLNLDAGQDEKNIFISQRFRADGRNIISNNSGIIRRGKIWIDLIPFENPNWNVYKTSDHMSFILKMKYLYNHNFIPKYSDIKKHIEEIYGLQNNLIEKDLYKKYVIDGLSKKENANNELIINITNSKKGRADLMISDDKMSASIKVEKGCGIDNDLTFENIIDKVKTLVKDEDELSSIEKKINKLYYSKVKDFTLEVAKGQGELEKSKNFVLNEFLISEENDITSKKDKIIENIHLNNISIGDIDTSKISKIYEVSKDLEVLQHHNIEPYLVYDIYGNILNPEIREKDKEIIFEYNISRKEDKFFSKIDGIILVCEDEKTIKITAIEHRDAKIIINIDKDYMKASLEYVSWINSGIRYMNEKEIDDEISKSGVVEGINLEKLKELKILIFKNEDISPPIPFAFGIGPIHGSNQELKIEKMEEKDRDFLIFNSSTFKGIDINYTKQGRLIAKLNPYREPKNGFDVYGHTVNAKHGIKLEIQSGENVEVKIDDDQTILYFAKLNGRIDFENNVLNVIEQYVIEGDIGPKTGNINFTGDILILGNVLDNFKVVSSKNIQISGDVNASLVVSKHGTINVAGGFKGHGKGIIKAKKEIQITYVENGTLLCTGKIIVVRSIINSTVKCQDELVLEEAGKIMGGTIFVSKKVDVDFLGSNSASTEINFGQDYLLYDKMLQYEKEMADIRESVKTIEKEIKELIKDDTKREDLLNEKEKLLKHNMVLSEKYKQSKLNFQYSIIPDAKVLVRKGLNIGTTIKSAGQTYTVEDPKNGMVFTYDKENYKIKSEIFIGNE